MYHCFGVKTLQAKPSNLTKHNPASGHCPVFQNPQFEEPSVYLLS